jgi:hypothetical protein
VADVLQLRDSIPLAMHQLEHVHRHWRSIGKLVASIGTLKEAAKVLTPEDVAKAMARADGRGDHWRAYLSNAEGALRSLRGA